MVELNVDVTQAEFGAMVGISQQSVSDLIKRDVMRNGMNAGQMLIAYCDHIREIAAGRAANGDLDLATERARLAREQADRIAMQNAITRGELTPTAVIEQVLAGTAAKVAGIFDAIPGMVRRRVPQLTSGDIDLIAAEIAKARHMVAAMSIHEVMADDGGDEEGEGPTSDPLPSMD